MSRRNRKPYSSTKSPLRFFCLLLTSSAILPLSAVSKTVDLTFVDELKVHDAAIKVVKYKWQKARKARKTEEAQKKIAEAPSDKLLVDAPVQQWARRIASVISLWWTKIFRM